MQNKIARHTTKSKLKTRGGWAIECGPQMQSKVAEHTTKSKTMTKGRLGYRLWTSDAKQDSPAHNKEQNQDKGRLGYKMWTSDAKGSKVAEHTTKSNIKKLAHLCGAAASATRRVGDSAATGLLGALLPLLPLCCLYFFVLLLHKPDQGITPSCQFLHLYPRHLAAHTALEETCMLCEGDDLQRHHTEYRWVAQGLLRGMRQSGCGF